MPVLRAQSTLTAEERRQKQRLILRDTIALSSLLVIAVVLSFVTYLLFHSFERHRQELAQRWKSRGEVSLKQGKPLQALDSLRSALAYEPDDRGLEIELATALAEAGRTQEAVVYFNTLRESEPGNGLINLQLARLAARQGNVALAVDEYLSAIDGTWFGDGFVRRRAIRFELSKYLIGLGRVDEARSQLLIAAGNAPEDMSVQLTVADLLTRSGDPRDALHIYRRTSENRPVRTESLVGAAGAALAMGRYLQARDFAETAVGQPDFSRQPESLKDAAHSVIEEADQVLALYPSPMLPPSVRAARIAGALALVEAQLAGCGDPSEATRPAGTPNARNPGVVAGAGAVAGAVVGAVSGAVSGTLRAAGIGRAPAASPSANATPQSPLDGLRARLAQLPTGRALNHQLERDPVFAQATLQLIWDTEKAAAGSCKAAPASKQEMLLMKISQAPDAVEQM